MKTALIIIDMQRSYLDPTSDHNRMTLASYPRAKDYIFDRCAQTVVPNQVSLLEAFRKALQPVIFIRLCGTDPERKDLNPNLVQAWIEGCQKGYGNLCPVATDPYAEVIDDLAPANNEIVINKTTYSPFTSTNFDKILQEKDVSTVVITGIITSQCVETTARDASDHGYQVINIEDAQSDYDETYHTRSLLNSVAVCGSEPLTTEKYLREFS